VTSDFVTFAVIGFIAQLVDGTIGMAYGVVSATALLSAGLSPLSATANIHFAELVTGGLSGIFHARRQQVSWALVRRLAIAGCLGASIGALLLVTLAPRFVEWSRRVVASYLLLLGLWLCWRATRQSAAMPARTGRTNALGFAGGLFDAAGGGWGPIVTSNLMIAGIAPKVAVGSSIVAEFFVTTVHVVVFAGIGGLRPEVAMVGLLVGGVIAAPLGPALAARLPTRVVIFIVGLGVVVASASLVVR
jgi:uncharacterized membrane protein YfcA